MKIIFLSDGFPPNRFGGAEIVAFNLAKALKQKGYSTFVITTVQDKKNEEKVGFEGFTVFRIYSKYHERWRAYLSIYNPQTVGKVKKLIQEIKPDIVHVHNIHFYLSYHCLKIAKKSQAKVFLTAHDAMLFHYGKVNEFINPVYLSCLNDFNYKVSRWQMIKKAQKRYNPFRNPIIHYYLKYVDKIFAVSSALKQALNQNGIQNVEVIHNGIDVGKWQVLDNEVLNFKKKFKIEGKKVICFGGRLSFLKGAEVMLKAMERITKKLPETVLLIAGKMDNYAINLLRKAKEFKLDKNIIFTDWLAQRQMKIFYGSGDVVVVPSLYLDPLPTINLEAMASKKPVVGTCFGGTPEIVVDGVTGYIVNPYNINLLAEKVIDLLRNEQKAKEFGENGFERVKENFSLDSQVKKIISWYQQ